MPPPFFIGPPPLEGNFQGWGVGVYRIWSRIDLIFIFWGFSGPPWPNFTLSGLSGGFGPRELEDPCVGSTQRAQRSKKFDLDRNFQSRSKFLIFKLENFNLDVSISPQKIGPRWVARKRAEYGFGEYGFKHRTQWVFLGSLSSGDRTQWVPFGLLFVCKRELTEFLAELTEFAAELSEFSSPKQYSRNSIPPVPQWPARKFHSRSKFSISIEISNYFDLWALWKDQNAKCSPCDPANFGLECPRKSGLARECPTSVGCQHKSSAARATATSCEVWSWQCID